MYGHGLFTEKYIPAEKFLHHVREFVDWERRVGGASVWEIMMRTFLAACCCLLPVLAGCGSAPKKPNPLFTPPTGNPFADPIYAAPTTGELPTAANGGKPVAPDK